MNICDMLKRDEGERLKPYRDTSTSIGFEGKIGKLTIGVGRNLDDDGILPAEKDFMLQNDVAACESLLASYLPWTTQLKQSEEVRYWGLVNLCFMGIHTLLEFKHMLAALQSGDWERAAMELGNSAYAHEVPGRAGRIEEQFRSGVWQ